MGTARLNVHQWMICNVKLNNQFQKTKKHGCCVSVGPLAPHLARLTRLKLYRGIGEGGLQGTIPRISPNWGVGNPIFSGVVSQYNSGWQSWRILKGVASLHRSISHFLIWPQFFFKTTTDTHWPDPQPFAVWTEHQGCVRTSRTSRHSPLHSQTWCGNRISNDKAPLHRKSLIF